MSLVKPMLMLKSQGWLMVLVRCDHLPSLEPGMWARACLGQAGMDTYGKGQCEPWLVFTEQLCLDVVYRNVLVLSSSMGLCVREEKELHSLTQCAEVYSTWVVTSSSLCSPPLFFFLPICQITWFGKHLIVHCMTLMFDISFLLQFKNI